MGKIIKCYKMLKKVSLKNVLKKDGIMMLWCNEMKWNEMIWNEMIWYGMVR
jgi:hypothetical protein